MTFSRASSWNVTKIDWYESTVPKKPSFLALRRLMVIGPSPITAESEKEKMRAR